MNAKKLATEKAKPGEAEADKRPPWSARQSRMPCTEKYFTPIAHSFWRILVKLVNKCRHLNWLQF